jgi:membrane protein implicated in regulation of membrane protease activity
LIIAAVLIVVEIFTPGMFLAGPLALAALAAMLVAAFTSGVAALLTFAVAAVLSLALIRPIARRHIRLPAISRTGTAALAGQKALVLRTVDETGGLVRIGGEDWTARAYIDGETFAEGTRVQVVEIAGATALVAE